MKWKCPTTVTEVQSFLGLAGYYRRFVQDFARIALPLTQLTKKRRTFRMGRYPWGQFSRSKIKVNVRSSVHGPRKLYEIRDLHWCVQKGARLRTDATWQGRCICVMSIIGLQEKLSYTWFGVDSSGVLIKNLATPPVWRKDPNLHG